MILIDGDIDKFSEESISLERLYIKDLKLLAALYELKINEGGVVADDSGDNDSFKRLEYEGLINKHINVITYCGNSKYEQSFSIKNSALVLGKVVQGYFNVKLRECK